MEKKISSMKELETLLETVSTIHEKNYIITEKVISDNDFYDSMSGDDLETLRKLMKKYNTEEYISYIEIVDLLNIDIPNEVFSLKNGETKKLHCYSEFDNTKIVRDFSVNNTGRREGEDILYDDSSTVRFKGIYLNGVIQEATEYHSNGKIESYVKYINGLREGLYVSYNKRGKVIIKGNYHKDERIGKWEFYDKKGNMTITQY